MQSGELLSALQETLLQAAGIVKQLAAETTPPPLQHAPNPLWEDWARQLYTTEPTAGTPGNQPMAVGVVLRKRLPNACDCGSTFFAETEEPAPFLDAKAYKCVACEHREYVFIS
jgi:hypothetical protein